MLLRSVLFFSLLYIQNAHARMYQWIDPDNGTTQLSGKPPTWYRSAKGSGPRTFVIEKGHIIDDTAIEISNEQRELLRQRAFLKVEEDREAAKLKMLKSKKIKAAFAVESDEKMSLEQQNILTEEEIVEEVNMDINDNNDDVNELTAEEMRAKIKSWENKRTEEAKNLLNPDT